MTDDDCQGKDLRRKPKFNGPASFFLASFALWSIANAQQTHRLFTTVKLESVPIASWVTPDNRKLVITTGDDQVLFYDLRLGRVTSRLRLDGSLLFIHVLPGDKLALIGHWSGRKISLIDLYGNRFTRSIPLGGGPTFFGQYQREVLVLLARHQKLAFLSPFTYRPIKEVEFNSPIAGLAVATQRGQAYVAVGMQQIAVVDMTLKKVIRTFNVVTARDTPLVVDPQERWLFALGPRNSVVRISLDEEKETKHISTGSGPTAMEISGDGKYLYVTNGLEGKVAIFDLESFTELEQVAVGVKPAAVHVSRDNAYVFVCNRGSRTISILERLQTDSASSVISHR
ncbi:MAG TPA: YncE family protein [Acidobacteriota bacterium]|jgi:DNA-binding beta-propeller fold protein YncE